MRKLPIVFLILCSLPPLASSQRSADSHSGIAEENEVVRVQDALIDAYIHRDSAALDRILADEYIFINDDAGGVADKKQILDSFKSGGDREITSYTRQDDRVRIYGDVAVLTYRYHSTETYMGRENGGDFRVTRIFAKQDGRWRIVGGQETRVSQNGSNLGTSMGNSMHGVKGAEETIMEIERQWAKAEEAYDPKVLNEILADGFVSMDGAGKVRDKAQEIASDGEWKPPGPEVVDDMSVHLNGDTAICLGRFTWTDRNSGSVVLQGRFVDTFLRRDGRWQVIANSYIVMTPLTVSGSRLDSPAPSARERLIGTWRLVSAGTFRRDGGFEPYPEYGPHPIGYLIYDPTGHMCVSLSNPNHPHWADSEKPTDGEKLHSYDAFFAYCGSYEIREKEGRVIHRPEMASWPHYIGTDQNRNFRLEGDRLILSDEETPPGGERRRYQITWERVTE